MLACHARPRPGLRPCLPRQFLCCGKSSPSGLLGGVGAELCPGQEAATQVRGQAPAGLGAGCGGTAGCGGRAAGVPDPAEPVLLRWTRPRAPSLPRSSSSPLAGSPGLGQCQAPEARGLEVLRLGVRGRGVGAGREERRPPGAPWEASPCLGGGMPAGGPAAEGGRKLLLPQGLEGPHPLPLPGPPPLGPPASRKEIHPLARPGHPPGSRQEDASGRAGEGGGSARSPGAACQGRRG